TTMSNQSRNEFLQERLDSLAKIDQNLVSVIDNLSSLLNHIHIGKKNLLINNNNPNSNRQTEDDVNSDIKCFFQNLEESTTKLRREIKLHDNRIGYNFKKDNIVSILPINLTKNATWVGDWNFKNQINTVDMLFKNDPNYEQIDDNNNDIKKEDNNDDSNSNENKIEIKIENENLKKEE
ncbi:Med11p ASCRUDRAFT_19704, partial [Ascoidea rubescens DSM 1968]